MAIAIIPYAQTVPLRHIAVRLSLLSSSELNLICEVSYVRTLVKKTTRTRNAEQKASDFRTLSPHSAREPQENWRELIGNLKDNDSKIFGRLKETPSLLS